MILEWTGVARHRDFTCFCLVWPTAHTNAIYIPPQSIPLDRRILSTQKIAKPFFPSPWPKTWHAIPVTHLNVPPTSTARFKQPLIHVICHVRQEISLCAQSKLNRVSQLLSATLCMQAANTQRVDVWDLEVF